MTNAYAIFRVEFTDPEDIRRFGISQMAAMEAAELDRSYTHITVAVVEVNGPDDPIECSACGCPAHFALDEREVRYKLPCPTCEHPLCQGERT